jgi:hypothetical protein
MAKYYPEPTDDDLEDFDDIEVDESPIFPTRKASMADVGALEPAPHPAQAAVAPVAKRSAPMDAKTAIRQMVIPLERTAETAGWDGGHKAKVVLKFASQFVSRDPEMLQAFQLFTETRYPNLTQADNPTKAKEALFFLAEIAPQEPNLLPRFHHYLQSESNTLKTSVVDRLLMPRDAAPQAF